MVEEWRDIKGYEGKYQVSNMGRVKSLDRLVSRSGRVMHLREKLLKPRVNPFGYCSVHLYCNGNGKNIFIHIERGFTDDVIREINRRANSGDKLKKLAIDYGCSESYIWKIKYQKVYLMNGEW